ncbi:PREDICTED: tumor necrosis factor receptor superfamily member 14 isoform X2 [Myotis brandtii]|uniref:tumor necrosis factor receptor superfamily member 14 isoform X2 n=1 Tax=Myotis brandtii TaxID=109478 RepID=UPI000703E566|nr:PREDICTED: tumor necrosis factor receptor superfamily member 14 isoform X2 [Myotis brandtii]
MPSCKEEEFPTGAMCCPKCRPGLGQVTRRKCSAQTNTVCGCGRGHFCEKQDGDSCVQCRPHRVCRPGQRVRETGTEWQGTLCEDCQPGTFSAGGTQAACTPWTRCSGPFARGDACGTSSSDVTCSSWGPLSICVIISFISLVIFIAVISVSAVLRAIRDRRSRSLQEPLVPSGLRSQLSHPRHLSGSVPQIERRSGVPGVGLPV